MAAYPTLTSPVFVKGFSEEIAFDPTIRTKTEAGYVVSRPRFTRIPLKWTIIYPTMSRADKDTLATFERSTTLGGSYAFTWTNPDNSTGYTVRFLGPIKFTHTSKSSLWHVDFGLEQV